MKHPTTSYKAIHISYAYLNTPQSNDEITVDVLTDHNQAKEQEINNNQAVQ